MRLKNHEPDNIFCGLMPVFSATLSTASANFSAFLTVFGLTFDCSAIFCSVFLGVVTVTIPLFTSSSPLGIVY